MLPKFLSLVLLLKHPEEAVGPLAHASDVEGEVAADLGGGADGERMPLTGGNSRDLDEDPITGTEVETLKLNII